MDKGYPGDHIQNNMSNYRQGNIEEDATRRRSSR